MKNVNKVFVVLLVSLALFSAIAKIFQFAEEMAFFQGVLGFSTTVIVAFGVVQLLSAVLLAMVRTRVIGAGMLAITLLVSTAVLFKSGDAQFALFSMLPVLLAGFVIYYHLKHAAAESGAGQS